MVGRNVRLNFANCNIIDFPFGLNMGSGFWVRSLDSSWLLTLVSTGTLDELQFELLLE